MKNKKLLLTVLCAMLLVVTSVLGTLAYLTSRQSITNTFTVGDVNIKLDESDVSTPNDTEDRTEVGNVYHIIPGETYVKDPTITVLKKSEESYVRMIMNVHNASAVDAIIANTTHGLTDYADLFTGWDNTKWLYKGYTKDDENDIISFEFRYYQTVSGDTEEDKKLEPLFETLVAPKTLTKQELEALYGNETSGEFKIVVEGHAIQKATFADEDAAWTAFDAQYPAGTAIED